MKRVLSALLIAALLATAVCAAPADTAAYVLKTVQSPQVGSTGGEWAVIGLARSETSVPQSWYDGYLQRLTAHVQQCGGVLDARKYTEYSRVILALTALGKDAAAFAGYDLTLPLSGRAIAMVERVDEACCNPLKCWHDMGEPADLSKEQLEFLRGAGRPAHRVLKTEKKNAGTGVSLTLNPNAVARLRLLPKTGTSDPGYDYTWYCG